MTKNAAIGACPCPIPKCAESCEVKKFQSRATKDTGKRYGGKWYLICPQHGRLGMDGKDAMQDYIGDHARMFNPDELKHRSTPAPAASPPASPTAPPSSAAPAAEPTKPKPRSWADFDL